MAKFSDLQTEAVEGLPSKADSKTQDHVLAEAQRLADKGIPRRALLGGLAAAALPVSAVAGNTPTADAIFLAEIEEWRQAYDETYKEDDCGPLWAAKCAIVDRIRDRPASTAIGFCVKLLVLTEYGEFDLAEESLWALLDDAKRVVGVPMPDRMASWYAEQEARA